MNGVDEFDWNEEIRITDESELNPTASNNYGKRERGPSVAGISEVKNYVRFIEVADGTASTLTNVIQSHEEGGVIVTDQCKGYNREQIMDKLTLL